MVCAGFDGLAAALSRPSGSDETRAANINSRRRVDWIMAASGFSGNLFGLAASVSPPHAGLPRETRYPEARRRDDCSARKGLSRPSTVARTREPG